MKKSMKLICFLLAVLFVLPFCLVGCGGYASHYKATLFVHSQKSDEAMANFSSLEGSFVQQLNCKEAGKQLVWSASLGEGKATVFYDNGSGKNELFSLNGGEEAASSIDLRQGRVYLILETEGACKNGSFRFAIE